MAALLLIVAVLLAVAVLDPPRPRRRDDGLVGKLMRLDF